MEPAVGQPWLGMPGTLDIGGCDTARAREMLDTLDGVPSAPRSTRVTPVGSGRTRPSMP